MRKGKFIRVNICQETGFWKCQNEKRKIKKDEKALTKHVAEAKEIRKKNFISFSGFWGDEKHSSITLFIRLNSSSSVLVGIRKTKLFQFVKWQTWRGPKIGEITSLPKRKKSEFFLCCLLSWKHLWTPKHRECSENI